MSFSSLSLQNVIHCESSSSSSFSTSAYKLLGDGAIQNCDYDDDDSQPHSQNNYASLNDVP